MGAGRNGSRIWASRRGLAAACVLGVLALAASASGAGGPSFRLQAAELDDLAELGLPIYCAGGNKPYFALTFDDGPGPYTPQLLTVLERRHARATFFLVGENVVRRRNRRLARRELEYGAVGQHSWDHPVLNGLPPAELDMELRRPQESLHRALGRRIRLFRPPFGKHDAAVDAKVKELKLVQILWNVDSGDASEPSTPSAERIAQHLVDRVEPGSIVLLHENITGTPSIRAVDLALPKLLERGLIPVSVPELLALDPPDPDAVAEGRAGCRSTWRPAAR